MSSGILIDLQERPDASQVSAGRFSFYRGSLSRVSPPRHGTQSTDYLPIKDVLLDFFFSFRDVLTFELVFDFFLRAVDVNDAGLRRRSEFKSWFWCFFVIFFQIIRFSYTHRFY